jgi:hypothetical protein
MRKNGITLSILVASLAYQRLRHLVTPSLEIKTNDDDIIYNHTECGARKEYLSISTLGRQKVNASTRPMAFNILE